MNRKAVFAPGLAEADVAGHGEDRAGAGADALDRGDDRLRAGAHRPDQVAGHAREFEQAVIVHLGQRADDFVDVAAGAEIAARAADHDHLHLAGVGRAHGTCRAARHSCRRSAGSSARAG